MRMILVWLYQALSLLLVLLTFRALLEPMALSMPDLAYYFPENAPSALSHLIFGPLALALAPLQTSAGLRRLWPRWHRRLGYLYALSVLVGGVASLVMLPWFRGSLWAAAGFALLALGWIGATARAIWLARRGDLAGHRCWMLRSAALTFSSVTLRLIMAPLMAAGWTSTETYDVTAWACWLVNLTLLELFVLRRRKVRAASAV
ncbi:DUF2306 domain-containing protein [Frigidibacter sp. RF13]|uniref:DUF2306 domain-containing protein n=1 Tax=Frigidibacter sp. RF13 TaxID=2997340 RepID=UPI002271961B|nr:DUF2306 domain-containing protein [Frigidibacter sp. RF13]MCY1126130.1 DUF2306 domain-containing protein [Frigidibacter sp. RF13]